MTTNVEREPYIQLSELLDNLQVEQLDTCLFRGFTRIKRLSRVFGGQVLAQAVNAASRTVEPERKLHSLHAYFLRPGDPATGIIYDVDPIRNGKSFTTRRVVARQGGKAIFSASLSFQVDEPGLEHQIDLDMATIPAPESLVTEEVYWDGQQQQFPNQRMVDIGQFRAIETRALKHRDLADPQAEAPCQGAWIKACEPLPDDPALNRVLLAYFSDMALMGTALLPHPVSFWTPGFQGASLDHALWYHTDVRLDDWLLYYMDSPRSGGARGFNRGGFYTREGQLVASVAQEGLIRLKPS